VKSLESKKEYYVYGLIDPIDNELFYVGKGIGNRVYDHLTEVYLEGRGNKDKIERIENIVNMGLDVNIKYFAKNLSERDALILEEIIVFRIGRKWLGFGNLTNWESGGDGEEKITNNLLENEDQTLNLLKDKLPHIYEIAIKIPKTTSEPELRKKWNKAKNEAIIKALDLIDFYDYKLLAEIEAKNINFFNNFPGNSIEFDSKIGHIQLSYYEEKNNRSSLRIKKDGNILIEHYMCLDSEEITTNIRNTLHVTGK